MTFRPVLALCLIAAPLAHAESALLDHLPPGASFALGVKVRSLMDSPMAKSMAGEMRKASADLNRMISLGGFDPFRDVDEIVVAAVGQGKDAPGLLLARGRFAGARRKPGGTPYKGVSIVGKAKSATAFLDDATLVAGDVPMVKAAIDRRSKATASELRPKIEAMASRYDIWGVGKIPDGAVPAEGMAQAMKGVDQFQFGVKVGSGLDVVAELHARTDQDAQALAQTMQLLTAMAAQQKGGEDLAKALGVKVEGRDVRLSLAISEAALAKAVESHRAAAPQVADAASPAGARGRAQASAKAPQRDPRFSKDTVLIITGAESDGGTIVIRDPKQN